MVSNRKMTNLVMIAVAIAALIMIKYEYITQKFQHLIAKENVISENRGNQATGIENFTETHSEFLTKLPDDKFIGNLDAENVMIEYSSLSCPHCASFHESTFVEIKEKLIDTGKLLYIHRSYPSDLQALKGTIFLQCLPKEQYFKFLSILFKQQQAWVYEKNFEETLETIAKVGGVYDEDFRKCVTDSELQKQIVEKVTKQAKELKIDRTPTFFVNRILLQKPAIYENFGALLKN